MKAVCAASTCQEQSRLWTLFWRTPTSLGTQDRAWGSVTRREYRKLLSTETLYPSQQKSFSILKHLHNSEPHNKRWDAGNQSLCPATFTCAISDRSRMHIVPGMLRDWLQWGNLGNSTLMGSGSSTVRAEAFTGNSWDSLQGTRCHNLFCKIFWQKHQKNLWIFCFLIVNN